MSAAYTQKDRLIAVVTNAGEDVLLLDQFSGSEGVSHEFRFVLNMLSETETGNPAKVKPHELVGTSMSVRIELTDPITKLTSGQRFFTGLCERFVQEDQDENFAAFTAVIVPWFSFLEYSSDCRIFQDKTTPQILELIVSERGFSKRFRLELAKTYTPRAYCVQYRETDRHFLSRLMESEGMFYYFEHTNGDHVMVVSDSPAGYKDLPIESDFNYSPVTGKHVAEDSIVSWRVEEEMHAGLWTHRDYHHESPTLTLESSTPSVDVAAAGQSLEVYDFPGSHAKKFNAVGSAGGARAEGDRLSLLRMQKEETFHKVVSGASTCRVFNSGYRISVNGGFAQGSYFLTELRHAVNQSPGYGDLETSRPGYSNSFRAIPASIQYAHPAEHGRPAVNGLQTARVIDESPSGQSEEIWPDIYGRVRVRFPWDREAKYACWLRVVQPWAGKAWGQQWIPRVGDEVAVSFLEGDPDCPVIVGGIYNAANMPIFSLPANKTQSGMLTHSSPGGGPSNYNMLRFEDKIGGEEIHLQAEKNLTSLVKNDETRSVQNNRTTVIHVNDTRTVETGQDTVTVQQGDQTITVHQNIAVTAQQGNITTTADQGNITIQAQAGHVTITSPQSITLRCGGSTISMVPGEISITSPMVKLN